MKNSKLDEILGQFGLRENERRIYVASLTLGSATALAIAQQAGIQRTSFYDLAEGLVAQGLLSQEVRGKKRYFVACEPDELVRIQTRRLEKLQAALPELKALHNTLGKRPKLFYYEGPNGIAHINEDTLLHSKEIVGFTTPRFLIGQSRNTGSAFIRKRVAAGVRARVIGESSPEIVTLKARDAEELRDTRILSHEVFHSEVEIVIYGDRVAIIDYRHVWGFILESQEIAHVMKMVFEIVWGRWDHN